MNTVTLTTIREAKAAITAEVPTATTVRTVKDKATKAVIGWTFDYTGGRTHHGFITLGGAIGAPEDIASNAAWFLAQAAEAEAAGPVDEDGLPHCRHLDGGRITYNGWRGCEAGKVQSGLARQREWVRELEQQAAGLFGKRRENVLKVAEYHRGIAERCRARWAAEATPCTCGDPRGE